MHLVHFLKCIASTADDVPNHNIKKGNYQYTDKDAAAQTAVQKLMSLTFFDAASPSSWQPTTTDNTAVVCISTSIGDDSRGQHYQSEDHPPLTLQ